MLVTSTVSFIPYKIILNPYEVINNWFLYFGCLFVNISSTICVTFTCSDSTSVNIKLTDSSHLNFLYQRNNKVYN